MVLKHDGYCWGGCWDSLLTHDLVRLLLLVTLLLGYRLLLIILGVLFLDLLFVLFIDWLVGLIVNVLISRLLEVFLLDMLFFCGLLLYGYLFSRLLF